MEQKIVTFKLEMLVVPLKETMILSAAETMMRFVSVLESMMCSCIRGFLSSSQLNESVPSTPLRPKS